MDKQKQIEEIYRLIDNSCALVNNCIECQFGKQDKLDCDKLCIATALYNAGYRKIPKNAVVLTEERLKAIIEEEYKKALKGKVVLTMEEYEKLKKGIKTYNYTAMFDAQDAYRWEQGYLQGTKETAEKFAERLKIEFDEILLSDTPLSKIDEIAKEITEGKV